MRKWYTHEPDPDATDVDQDFAVKRSVLSDLLRERTRKLAQADDATKAKLEQEIADLEAQIEKLDQEKIRLANQ